MCFPTRKVILLSAFISLYFIGNAQTIGIGVDVPTATLDVRSTSAIITLNVQRTLSGSASGKSAAKITDASDHVALEVNQTKSTNNSQVLGISNAGLNNALRASNTSSSNNSPTALFTNAGNASASALEVANESNTNSREVVYAAHEGVGIGMLVELINGSNASDGIQVTHEGTGDGMYLLMNKATGAQQALDVTHYGVGHGIRVDMANSPSSGSNYGILVNDYQDNQVGLVVDNNGSSAWGVLNEMDNGVALYNDFAVDGGVSVFTDMENLDGAGYFFTNVDLASLPTVSGTGDGFALDAFINTTTSSVGSIAYGAIVGGEQYGSGHGVLVNHYGSSGRNAEFNVNNAANASPAIFSLSSGIGPVITGQQQNNSIGAQVRVADFSYTGTEALDHIAVYGSSVPISGSGIGGYFAGGKYGVYGNGGSISAVHAQGNMSATGTKPFMIDHPLDPENKILRHFSIESNEVLNMYRGIAEISRGGTAEVELPEYFSAINSNFTYQLTPIGTPNQPYIAKEIEGNKFVVAGKPGTKVSWTIHANRTDAFVRTHPNHVSAEIVKQTEDRGKFLDPESHGYPLSKGMQYSPAVEEAVTKRAKPVIANEAFQKASTISNDKVLETDHARMLYKTHERPSTSPAATAASPLERKPAEIRMEIKTWDELH